MRVYLDTNVFDHIDKRIGGSSSDLRKLQTAVSKRRLIIVLSYLNLEEVLTELDNNSDQAQSQLRLILSLTSTHHFVRPADQLLRDDIRSYAEGKPLTGPFISIDKAFRQTIHALANDKRGLRELSPVVTEVRREKEVFRDAMKEAGYMVWPAAKQFLIRNHGKQPTWQGYWDQLAPNFAEGFTTERYPDLCSSRGIEGLLAVPSVRVAVGGSVSYAYAETFEMRTPKIGDSRDLQHAVLATSSDIFITHDRQLARLLKRVPQICYEIKELPEFLEQNVM